MLPEELADDPLLEESVEESSIVASSTPEELPDELPPELPLTTPLELPELLENSPGESSPASTVWIVVALPPPHPIEVAANANAVSAPTTNDLETERV